MFFYNEDLIPLIKMWQSIKKKYIRKNKINSDTYKKSLLNSSYNNLLLLNKFNSAKIKKANTY
jgi:hypothetical protein